MAALSSTARVVGNLDAAASCGTAPCLHFPAPKVPAAALFSRASCRGSPPAGCSGPETKQEPAHPYVMMSAPLTLCHASRGCGTRTYYPYLPGISRHPLLVSTPLFGGRNHVSIHDPVLVSTPKSQQKRAQEGSLDSARGEEASSCVIVGTALLLHDFDVQQMLQSARPAVQCM